MAATRLPHRLKMLRTIDAVPHRYRRIRLATLGITLAVLYAVPLSGLARFDLWGGNHLALFKPVNAIYGAAATVFSIVGFYFVTFLINSVGGRLFCGFGCPVGHASRLGDLVELAASTGKDRPRAEGNAALFALALGVAAVLWVTSPRVFIEGSAKAIATAAGAVVGFGGGVYLHSRLLRWRFCKEYCPIGVYYSAVQTEHAFGIHFDEAMGTCGECDACAHVCPVDLYPRDLSKPINDLGGIALEGFPARNHCLSCGDCVRVCENIFREKGVALAPLNLSRRPRGQERAKQAAEAHGSRELSRPSRFFQGRKPDGQNVLPDMERLSAEKD